MILPSPRLLVAAANAFIGIRAEADAHRAAFLELIMADMDDPGGGTNGTAWDARWDAAFVHHVGFWSHYDHRGRVSSWPLPALRNCDDLAAYAKQRNVLVPDPCPAHGDVFVQWSPTLKRYARAGIIIGPLGAPRQFDRARPYVECCVIEGNSDAAGRLGGESVVRVTRKLFVAQRDRVIRWTALALSLRAADPMRVGPNGSRIGPPPDFDMLDEWRRAA